MAGEENREEVQNRAISSLKKVLERLKDPDVSDTRSQAVTEKATAAFEEISSKLPKGPAISANQKEAMIQLAAWAVITAYDVNSDTHAPAPTWVRRHWQEYCAMTIGPKVATTVGIFTIIGALITGLLFLGGVLTPHLPGLFTWLADFFRSLSQPAQT